MSSYSVCFVFVQCVAPSLIYYIIFKLETGLNAELLISFCAFLKCSLLFHWSALHVGGGLFLQCFPKVKENCFCHFTDGTLRLGED